MRASSPMCATAPAPERPLPQPLDSVLTGRPARVVLVCLERHTVALASTPTCATAPPVWEPQPVRMPAPSRCLNLDMRTVPTTQLATAAAAAVAATALVGGH